MSKRSRRESENHTLLCYRTARFPCSQKGKLPLLESLLCACNFLPCTDLYKGNTSAEEQQISSTSLCPPRLNAVTYCKTRAFALGYIILAYTEMLLTWLGITEGDLQVSLHAINYSGFIMVHTLTHQCTRQPFPVPHSTRTPGPPQREAHPPCFIWPQSSSTPTAWFTFPSQSARIPVPRYRVSFWHVLNLLSLLRLPTARDSQPL